MNIETVYTQIQYQLDKELPFVIYRKADSDALQTFLQNDSHLYEVGDYSISGFVFAPFDNTNESVIFPLEHCVYHTVTIPKEMMAEDDKSSVVFRNILEDSKAKFKHLELVNKGVDSIVSNCFEKVVLSRSEVVGELDVTPNQPLQLFKKLIAQYPKAFVYLWHHPKVGMWLGATPETLVTINNRDFSTMALAGTQSYIDTLDVEWGDKEIVEQDVVKEFVVNGLKEISSEIECSETYTSRAGSLLHLRTDIRGVLSDVNSGIKEILQILHPTPAVCGLPKDKAKSFILNNEGYDRKYYTGFLGELNIENKGIILSSILVNLRCMELTKQKAIIYVGGGITKDSDPESEWEETVRKTETMKKVLF
ncbi:isochorismate synthase [Aquimarina sediminis]|uniref:isochorismate synthase n=1 Tax=Aquimarina sediminis TaxID=2070536 RepID=UPI000CA07C6A|nr:isochorismate synthase [Aquimarina sediminis]